MKPEYIKIMQRKIHAANVLMGRQYHRPDCNFNTYVSAVCPCWRLSEKIDTDIDPRYEIACIITGISTVERKPDKYIDLYADYLVDWFMNPANEGDLPPTPEEWKINEKVQ
jgi:hypothetical protein|nr:MAG TPA: hypothetical protein [Caudoviricetes sp.]